MVDSMNNLIQSTVSKIVDSPKLYRGFHIPGDFIHPGFHTSIWASGYVNIHPFEGYNVYSIKPQVRGYEELLQMLDKRVWVRPKVSEEERKTIVEVVMLAEINGYPVVLAIRSPDNEFNVSLPGVVLSSGETVKQGLKRCFSDLLLRDVVMNDLKVVRCLCTTWVMRDGTHLPYEYQKSKICRRVYLVQLPVSLDFGLAEHVGLVPFSLPALHDNKKHQYDAVLSRLPLLLSKMLWSKAENEGLKSTAPQEGVKWISSLPQAVDTSTTITIYPYRKSFAFTSESQAQKPFVQHPHIDEYGMTVRVEALLVVQSTSHPSVLTLQQEKAVTLPGGLVGKGESEIQALKRCLSSLLREDKDDDDWEVRAFIGAWWGYRTGGSLEYAPYPIFGSEVCRKVFLVQLTENPRFVAPYSAMLLPVSFTSLHLDKHEEKYDDVLSGLPLLLSKFKFKFIGSSVPSDGGTGPMVVAATGGGGGTAAAEEKVEEKDESDYDMGFRLFD